MPIVCIIIHLPTHRVINVSEDDMPPGQENFLELNEELSAIWPVITASKPPPEDAVEWDGVEGKLEHLER